MLFIFISAPDKQMELLNVSQCFLNSCFISATNATNVRQFTFWRFHTVQWIRGWFEVLLSSNHISRVSFLLWSTLIHTKFYLTADKTDFTSLSATFSFQFPSRCPPKKTPAQLANAVCSNTTDASAAWTFCVWERRWTHQSCRAEAENRKC